MPANPPFGPNTWPPPRPAVGKQTWPSATTAAPRPAHPASDLVPPQSSGAVVTARHLAALWLAVAAVALAVLVLAVAHWQRPVNHTPPTTVTSIVSTAAR